mmetsp:Transcript_49455/g.78245  ORF Transcript_49455/g.78245 Transcript_49455/m.78245 type:complete len:210 (+) Transcript_49455:832-1461(+)
MPLKLEEPAGYPMMLTTTLGASGGGAGAAAALVGGAVTLVCTAAPFVASKPNDANCSMFPGGTSRDLAIGADKAGAFGIGSSTAASVVVGASADLLAGDICSRASTLPSFFSASGTSIRLGSASDITSVGIGIVLTSPSRVFSSSFVNNVFSASFVSSGGVAMPRSLPAAIESPRVGTFIARNMSRVPRGPSDVSFCGPRGGVIGFVST